MPDITMCEGTGCPLKEKCYRHKAMPGLRQSYFMIVPYDHKKKSCDYYWSLEEATRILPDNYPLDKLKPKRKSSQ